MASAAAARAVSISCSVGVFISFGSLSGTRHAAEFPSRPRTSRTCRRRWTRIRGDGLAQRAHLALQCLDLAIRFVELVAARYVERVRKDRCHLRGPLAIGHLRT